MSRAIGIDLGTTFSCAAIVDDGRPQIIRSRLGYSTIPSIVAFVGGRSVIGQPAEREMILRPEDTIYGAKRLLGRHVLPGVLDKFQPHFQYQLVADDQGFVAAHVAGRVVSFVDVSAMILRELRAAAAEGLGYQVDRAVITVPAYFNENQRQLVREAGRRSGLEVLRIINEPTAAALCFGYKQTEKKRVLVFDLGGGTFDVSILDIDGNIFNVIGTDGDTFLGGLDFDARVVAHFTTKLEASLKTPIRLDPVSAQRLRAAAQEAKQQLSVQEMALVNLPAMTLVDGTQFAVAGPVTRQELEHMSSDLVDRALEITARALATAGLTRAQIDDVLLVGGQTRMPVIHRRLREMFGREPTKRIHPDEVVALGAAIAADSHDRFDAAVLMDVVPLPIGIVGAGGRFRSVIGRNTPVPHTATIEVTIEPAQTVVKLAVFQGDRIRAADNDYLGMLILDDAPAAAAPQTCELTFHLDSECLLTVRARIGGTDRAVTLATQQTPDDVLATLGAERVRTVKEGGQTSTPLATTPPRRAASQGTALPQRGLWTRLVTWFQRSR